MAGKIAHAYPGQGAQFPDMETYFSKKINQIASESFPQLVDMLANNDEKVLTETFYVQPAIYLVETSLMEKLPPPALALGHSSGEYAALVEAKVWDVRTGFEIIRARGHFSQSSAPKGFMVQIPAEIKNDLLNEFKDVYEAAINSADKVVVAGLEEKWVQVKSYLEDNHVNYHLLPISAPFHTPFMEKAAKRLHSFLTLNRGKVPEFPVYLNALNHVIRSYDDVVEGLSLGLIKPINWLQAQEFVKRSDIDALVEVYPHPYLSKFTGITTHNAVEYYHLDI
ncbi:ACP S-malonyltransferase [Coprothermobacter platensis]|uniref:ACP S-malonyltransferase n=1 Tax=Coprothermobacter platensis TaxID=108819 RepID=UPI0003814F5E|nr:ACP S-malonyltransferase [Coprothermobacter platensis]